MPDDLQMPSAASGPVPQYSSYRTRRPGMDRGTKYLLGAAAGLSGLLLAGMAGWAFMGGHSTAVPVIEADSRPIRVKPENAGGLQVVGADDQVMGGQGGKTQGMAPAAEVPAPQALRAQMPPGTPPQGRVPDTPLPAPPEAAASTPPPAPPRPAAPAQATRPPATLAAGPVVQLAAVDSEQVAQSEWQRLAKRMPDLLGDRRPILQRVERDGRAVWRVRTGGFADLAEATGFCARVRSKGGSCAIGNF